MIDSDRKLGYINTRALNSKVQHEGLVIYNSAVEDGRIQNNMTKILNPPLRSTENILTLLTCKIKNL